MMSEHKSDSPARIGSSRTEISMRSCDNSSTVTGEKRGSERASERDVLVTRRIDEGSRFVIKEIELRDEGRRFQERVRLYGVDELAALFAQAGLHVIARFGDYDGGPAALTAPRAILVGRKA